MKLKDRVAIITGGGSGIGRAASLIFAREGAKVVVADMIDANGEETVNLICVAGGEAIFIHTDVTSATEAERLIMRAIDTYGGLEILFNVAGKGQISKPAEMVEEEEWDSIFAVNVKGAFLTAKYAIPEMKQAKRGVIINTGSIAAVRKRPNVDMAAYASAKAALLCLTRNLAVELAPFNIRVNCINPGPTRTPMIYAPLPEGASEEEVRRWEENVVSATPLGRIVEPDEIAYGALYFASDEASIVTGQVLNIDGGRVA